MTQLVLGEIAAIRVILTRMEMARAEHYAAPRRTSRDRLVAEFRCQGIELGP